MRLRGVHQSLLLLLVCALAAQFVKLTDSRVLSRAEIDRIQAVKAVVDGKARVLVGERWSRAFGHRRVAQEVKFGQTPSAAPEGPVVAAASDARKSIGLLGIGPYFKDAAQGASADTAADGGVGAGPFVAAGNDASVVNALANGAMDSSSGPASSSSSSSAPVFKSKGWKLPYTDQPIDFAPKPVSYHGGAVLSDPITVYLIWHGTWPEERKAPVRAFVQSLSDAGLANEPGSVRDWWNANRLYHAGREHVTGSVTLGTPEVEIDAAPSSEGQPPASKNEINAIINFQIRSRTLPRHDSAVYAVFTSEDVDMAGFGSSFCAFHDVSTVHFTWTGMPSRFIPQCTHAASPGNAYPNGDRALDGLIANFAHVLAAAAANPNLLSWFDKEGREAMGLCGNNWGTEYASKDAPPVQYNAVGRGGERFLLPTNLNPITGRCINGLSVMQGQCGPKFFGFPCDSVTASEADTEPPAEPAAGLGAAAASVVGGEAEKAAVGGDGDARTVKDSRVAEAEAAGLDLSVGGKAVGRFLAPGQFDPAKGDRGEDEGSAGQVGGNADDSGAGSNVFESTGYADGGDKEGATDKEGAAGAAGAANPFDVEGAGDDGADGGVGAEEAVGAEEGAGADAGAGAEEKGGKEKVGGNDDVFQSTGYPDTDGDGKEDEQEGGGSDGGRVGASGATQPEEVNPFVHHAAAASDAGAGNWGGGDSNVFERSEYPESEQGGDGSQQGEESRGDEESGESEQGEEGGKDNSGASEEKGGSEGGEVSAGKEESSRGGASNVGALSLGQGGFEAGASGGFEFDLSQFKLGERESPGAPHFFPGDASASTYASASASASASRMEQVGRPLEQGGGEEAGGEEEVGAARAEGGQQLDKREQWVFSGV
ncbi:hypothetical protein CLOM_g4807 [Closterium sp. NIES-68]|nr:hypothetical protein CLOM_g4807 [Closterium sp. NIES-68]GJP57657.1 hypothetical protein CLOP_g14528 [Closterium sp. NIES-67]GJP60282.1 hypothetical protein CLOP_g17492 [Closterium sp. NIES-67]